MDTTKPKPPLVTTDLSALDLPGTLVIVEPDTADDMGFVEEEVISLEEALEADLDPEE
jgi:hypothetical protein